MAEGGGFQKASSQDSGYSGGIQGLIACEPMLLSVLCRLHICSTRHCKLQAEFKKRIEHIRKTMRSKELTVQSGWYTKEKMKTLEGFDKSLI